MTLTRLGYFAGYLVMVAGLCFAAHLLGAPREWIAAGAITLIGIGIMSAAARFRRRNIPRS